MPEVFTIPKFKELFFIFRDKSSSFEDELKLPALYFRKFIYSHFINKEEYRKFLENNPLTEFTNIVNNLVVYSEGCSPGESKDTQTFTAHSLVLELALQESFLRQEKMNLLLNVFGEDNIDALFGQGSHGERIEQETDPSGKKGMSFCFHQSEQSLLRYILETEGSKKYHNEFTSLLMNFIKDSIFNNFNTFKVIYRLDSEVPVDEPPLTSKDIPSLQDLEEKEVEFTSLPSLGKNLNASKRSKRKQEEKANLKELRVGIKENVYGELDIIFGRHICKYCRGTFYFSQQSILSRLKSVLLEEGISIRKNERPYGGLIEQAAVRLKLKEPLPDTLIIKFLGEVNLSILATAGISIKNDLMGKMEKTK
ncbi:MAG: hypothetical protein K0M45_10100 [Candidatus Paracaedibacteraceae bacterium]|nr:hypothetical protein [Candidatus Paracaedibacteraceae bacterium]